MAMGYIVGIGLAGDTKSFFGTQNLTIMYLILTMYGSLLNTLGKEAIAERTKGSFQEISLGKIPKMFGISQMLRETLWKKQLIPASSLLA